VQFLIDADLSPRLATLLTQYGHEAVHVDALFPPRTPDTVIAAFAHQTGRCIITGDFDLSDVREFRPRDYSGIIVLTLPNLAGAAYGEMLVREVMDRLPSLGDLAGKLLIVEPGRIRVRE